MECKDIRDLVVRYSSGDLTGPDRGVVESHLGECGECSTLYSRSNALWDLLDQWDDIEPRAEFVSEFWSRVSSEESGAGRGFFGFIGHIRPAWRLAGALATFLIVGVVTFAVFEPGGVDRDTRDEMILIELDHATSRDTTAALEVYGPWDSGIDTVNINGSGGFN